MKPTANELHPLLAAFLILTAFVLTMLIEAI